MTECPDDDVEGQVSSRSSPIPPSMGTKSKKHPRKCNWTSQHKRVNKSKRKQGGSRLVLNKSAIVEHVGGKNDRTCLLDVISQVLPNDKDKTKVFTAIFSAMPSEGDTLIMSSETNIALAPPLVFNL